MIQLIHGDCQEELKKLKTNSIDSIVTDPPYGLSKADNTEKGFREKVRGLFNIELPYLDKGDILLFKYSDFVRIFSQCSDLTLIKSFSVIEPWVSMPKSTINFNCDIPIREVEVKDSTESSSEGISNHILVDKIDVQGHKFIGDYIFDFGDSIDSSFSNLSSSNLGEFSFGSFSMPISSIFNSGNPSLSGDLLFPFERDGVFDIIWDRNNSRSDSFSSSFVLTGGGTEDIPVLRFDMTGGSDKSFATISTSNSDRFTNFIRPKLVRTTSVTGGFPSNFKPCRVSFIMGSTNGTYSTYFLHLHLPDKLIDTLQVYNKKLKKSGGFMNKKWDYNIPSVEVWKECLRVLKPGGYLLSFAGTRTQHRMACNIEDAGFEIRDMIAWIFGSGFPKSHNISKQLDLKEKNKWLNISKAIDKIDKMVILKAWKNNLKDVIIVGNISKKSPTVAGISMQKNGSAPVLALLSINLKKLSVPAIIAELNLNEVHPTIEGSTSFVQKNAEAITELSQSHVRYVGKSLEDHEAYLSVNTFIVPCAVRDSLNEKTERITKVEEALMIWLGKTKYSEKQTTIALCVELTDILKLTILNHSKTFLNLDTKSQMEVAFATIVTITESTAALLISSMANTLRNKAIGKMAGAEREVIGQSSGPNNSSYKGERYKEKRSTKFGIVQDQPDLTASATDEAKQWDGWGTALKPALEPITMARKPLSEKTVAQNVLKWGTGGINIDGCRIPGTPHHNYGRTCKGGMYTGKSEDPINTPASGRFPANLIHDGSEEVMELFPHTQSGSNNFKQSSSKEKNGNQGSAYGAESRPDGTEMISYGDQGSAARFFYCSKASKEDRGKGNDHPTVKPTDLMRYLIRLVTPKGGICLDPYMGSGTTGKGCKLENFSFIGIEDVKGSFDVAKKRIDAELYQTILF